MYRENDRSSIGGDVARNHGWQDWPPEPSSADPEGAPSQHRGTPEAKGDQAGVSGYLKPTPDARPSRNLPAPL